MFKALLKTQLASMGARLASRNGGGSGRRSSKLKTIGFAALMLYVCFAFMMMFGMYFRQIAEPFFSVGLGWLYFTLFAMTAFALMFIGSVFTVKSQLYEANDNELLLSLPIPPGLILASRMAMLMILNFFFELLVAVPALVMWVGAVPVSAFQLICFILIVLALPFLSMAVSSLFGWLIALSTGRVRNKSLMTVLFSLVFLGLYFFFFSRADTYIQRLVLNGQAIAGSLGSVAPLYWVGSAVASANAAQLLVSLLIMIAPFALMYFILSATFLKIATTKRGVSKLKYEAKKMRSASRSSALLGRETKHLLSSPVYILNSGFGLLFLLAGAAALVIKKTYLFSLTSEIGISGGEVSAAAVFALCLLCSTVMFTAPSVSLEGKTLWIVKSLPVSPSEVLGAKLGLHIYATIPAVLLASAAVIYTVGPSLPDIILIVLAPVFFVMLSANIGLVFNLKSPRFDWVSETQVVKQSMAVMLSMLANALIAIVPAILYFALFGEKISPSLFLSAFTLLLVIGWYISRKWINTRGAEIFGGLN